MPKWVPPLLILFVVFFILNNPSEAGPQTRSFFGWIGDQAGNAGTFLDGLFGESDATPDSGATFGPTSTTPTSTTPTTPTTGATQDSFNTMGPLVVTGATTT